MKSYAIAVVALLGFGVTLSNAENAMSNKTESKSVTTTQEESNQVKPSTEMQWTELRGEVQRIDLTAKIIQIKEKGTNTLVEVPVTPSIAVMDSSNHVIALGDLKQGQKVILRNTQQQS